MALVSLTADVYCYNSDAHPSYRIYVDNDMLTERTFHWNSSEIMIKEMIEVDVGPGAHVLTLRPCNGEDVFDMKDMTVNGAPLAVSGVFFV